MELAIITPTNRQVSLMEFAIITPTNRQMSLMELAIITPINRQVSFMELAITTLTDRQARHWGGGGGADDILHAPSPSYTPLEKDCISKPWSNFFF